MFISSIRQAGGGEGVLLALVSRLGPDALVLAPKGEVLANMKRTGVRTRKLVGPAELHKFKNHLWPLELVARTFIGWAEIALAIFVEKPNIMHVNNLAAGIYAIVPGFALRTPAVWHIHDVIRVGSPEARLVQCLHRLSSRIVVPSQASRRSIQAIGVPPDKVTVLHSGIDARARFNPDQQAACGIRQSLGISPGAVVLAVVGHITPKKGAHLVLEAVESLLNAVAHPDLHLIFVGKGTVESNEYVHRLQERVQRTTRLRGRVHFIGPRDDLASILMDVDILVQASLSPESFGRAVAEAMAMRKIVVASNSGALPELVDDSRTGYLFRPGDVQDLASKLTLAAEGHTRHEMGRAGRETILNSYDEYERNNRMMTIYGELAR